MSDTNWLIIYICMQTSHSPVLFVHKLANGRAVGGIKWYPSHKLPHSIFLNMELAVNDNKKSHILQQTMSIPDDGGTDIL
jgi:hypothetical protein